MLRCAATAVPRFRVAAFVLLAVLVAAACGATPSASPSDGAPAGSSPAGSAPLPTASPPAGASPTGSAAPKPTGAAATPKAFWAAVTRGLAAAKHVQVTLAGPNPGVLRFEPGASATIVGGKIGFVCVGGAAFDGQSGFARVPGTWQCGGAALVSGFRHIGQPADSWNATNPSDDAITEVVGTAPDGTWTWAYVGASAFYGGPVTARVSLDPGSGRILAARRTDPTGTTTYRFDYAITFPALAVPGH